MSYLPQSKFGSCSSCGATDTNVVKVKKDLFCISCHQANKTKVQIQKAGNRQRCRSLINYERAEGILDSISELTLDIDRVLSRYIRLRDMGKDHKIICYTCDKPVPYQKAHAMHFINRQHIGTRFLIQNVKSGCFTCNVEKRGNLEVFAKRLEIETPGIVEWLTEQSHVVTNVTKNELKEILFDYQQKLNLVEKKLTIKQL